MQNDVFQHPVLLGFWCLLAPRWVREGSNFAMVSRPWYRKIVVCAMVFQLWVRESIGFTMVSMPWHRKVTVCTLVFKSWVLESTVKMVQPSHFAQQHQNVFGHSSAPLGSHFGTLIGSFKF